MSGKQVGFGLFVLVGFFLSAETARANDPNLILWWSFDNDIEEGQTISDDSGYGHTALRNGGVTLITDGISGQAMSFNGTNGYLNLPMGVLEGFNPGNFHQGDFTISFWIKTAATRIEGIIGKREACDGSHSFWDLRLNGDISVELYTDSSSPGVNNNASGLRLVNDDTWHYVALTRSSALSKLYIDGKGDMPSPKDDVVVNLINTADIWVGRSRCSNSGDSTRYFSGMMDEIRIYERALSCAEIRAEYESFFDVHDLNRDTVIDFVDIKMIMEDFLQAGNPTNPLVQISPTDVAPGCGDTVVNYFDFAALAGEIQ